MKALSWMILAATLAAAGCASTTAPIASQPRTSYHWYGVQQSEGVQIKTVDGIRIWKLDGRRIASIPEVMIGKAYEALFLPAGHHLMTLTIDGKDAKLGSVEYLAGHEYLIDKLVYGTRTYYWVEDLTSKTVVLGRKYTAEDFPSKK